MRLAVDWVGFLSASIVSSQLVEAAFGASFYPGALWGAALAVASVCFAKWVLDSAATPDQGKD